MTRKITQSLAVLAVIALAVYFAVSMWLPNIVTGSVQPGGEYRAVTLPTTATLTQLCNQDDLQRAPGVLGSVFITSYGAGSLALVDATTSNNNLRASNSTTTLTKFHAPIMATSSWSGIDAVFTNGIMIVTSGTVGTTTITYRCVQ